VSTEPKNETGDIEIAQSSARSIRPMPRGCRAGGPSCADGATRCAGRFDWLKVIRKEYWTSFAWGSGFLLLLVLEHQTPPADPISATELVTVAAVGSALAVAYLTTRTLKLRGRLGRD
jgi:hypothetical protein